MNISFFICYLSCSGNGVCKCCLMGRITLSSRIHCPLKRKDGGGSFRMRQQDFLNLIGKILGHVLSEAPKGWTGGYTQNNSFAICQYHDSIALKYWVYVHIISDNITNKVFLFLPYVNVKLVIYYWENSHWRPLLVRNALIVSDKIFIIVNFKIFYDEQSFTIKKHRSQIYENILGIW